MGLLEFLEFLDFRNQKPTRVYCQFCSNELTNNETFISSDGYAYCGGDDTTCTTQASIERGNPLSGKYISNPRKIQREIRKGRLIHYEEEIPER